MSKLALALACTLISLYVSAEELTFLSPDIPPLIFAGGQSGVPTGPAIDLATQIAVRAGIKPTFAIFPWARAQALAETQPATCLVMTGRVPERESRYKWAGPLVLRKLVMLSAPNHARALASLDDARGLTIGTIGNSSTISILKAHGLRIEQVSDEETNYKKLLAGHIDLWAINDLWAKSIVQKMGGPKPPIVLVFGDWPAYMACSPTVSDALMARLNQAIQSIRAEGALRMLEDPY